MIEIDHNPHEKRPSNGVWWGAWIVVVIGWVWYLNYCEFDRDAIALGALTGIVLTLWSLEMKGDNEIPSWMRPKPRKRYFPPPIPGEPAAGPNGKALLFVIPAIVAVTGIFIWMRV